MFCTTKKANAKVIEKIQRRGTNELNTIYLLFTRAWICNNLAFSLSLSALGLRRRNQDMLMSEGVIASRGEYSNESASDELEQHCSIWTS